MSPDAIKACHPLGIWKGNTPPAVIVKFIYYNDKIELYNRRPVLANFRNPLNGKPVYVKERLPQHDLSLQKRANELDLVTTTYNWNTNQLSNQRRNKRPGDVIEIDNFDKIYHMGATPAGKRT